MPVALSPGLQQLLREPAHCQIATLMPDNAPQITQVWVDTDGEHILVNTAEGRQSGRSGQPVAPGEHPGPRGGHHDGGG